MTATIGELKVWAKEINPRLAIAYYGDRCLEFRLYDVSTWHWTQLGVCNSLDEAHAFLRGLEAAARAQLKIAAKAAA